MHNNIKYCTVYDESYCNVVPVTIASDNLQTLSFNLDSFRFIWTISKKEIGKSKIQILYLINNIDLVNVGVYSHLFAMTHVLSTLWSFHFNFVYCSFLGFFWQNRENKKNYTSIITLCQGVFIR
jgi:hypothetical protein